MGMLPELAAIGMQGAEDTHFNPLFAGPAEHGASGAAKEVIKQCSYC